MKFLTGKLARFIFAFPFAVFGILHFMNASQMQNMIEKWPMAEVLVYITGAGLIAAAVAIVINKHVRLASLLLAALLTIIIIVIHIPGMGNGTETMQMAMTNALKDIGLIGGALILAGTSEE